MKSRADRTQRVERLAKNARERSATTRAAAQRAILSLSNRGLPVTIKTVAFEAGVSESYLTKQTDLRDRIHALARTEPRAARPPKRALATTLASNQTKMLVMVDRIRELEQENRELRDENSSLRGALLELRRSAGHRRPI
ncbi:DUF6262 family protein [Mycolicibacterium senegalense]|uniref:DUF6262 family protein n=1 Tax=Mycolicibacterium senegalense TaxID=1796 RepID=UPI00362E4748